MSEQNNELIVTFVQKEDGKTLDTVTVHYPEGKNEKINDMQLDLIEGMVKVARGWTAAKAARGAVSPV